MKKSYFAVSFLLTVSVMLFANGTEEDKRKKGGEKESAQKEEIAAKPAEDNPNNLSGYVDSNHFLTSNRVRSNLGACGYQRIFDYRVNFCKVRLVQPMTNHSVGSVTGVVDLVFGNHADLGDFGNIGLPPRDNGIELMTKQAYFAWAMNDNVSLPAAQFGTNVEYEVAYAPANRSYSLSYHLGDEPFYRTSVNLDFAASDNFAVMVGTNSKGNDKKSKGIVAQIYPAPIESLDSYVYYFGSSEGTKEYLPNYSWFDIASIYQISDKPLLGLNAVRCGAVRTNNSTQSLSGIALLAIDKFTDKFSMGVTSECSDNSEGGLYLTNSAGNGTETAALTIVDNFDLAENLMCKPELRLDS